MNEQPTTPPAEPKDAREEEGDAESGAGYGNHAPDPEAPDGDDRDPA